jgi:tRNA pseudouridine38-40 synthase
MYTRRLPLRNIKLTIAYDGSRYNGWQRQDNTDNTIQGKFEQLLSRMTGEEIEIHGSGRTDGGVHAHGQVAHFHTNSQMSREEMLAYINEYLPMDIAVLDIRDAAERFHSRLNVKRKTYCYHIWNSPIPNVFLRKYSYQVPEPLDLPSMEQAASYLLGTHDFKSFCSRKKMKKSTVRMIESIQIEKNGDEILLTYKGNGFLYNMVRILTGTLIEVGKGLRSPEDIPSVIEAKNREMAGFTAPPQGLFLEKVDY